MSVQASVRSVDDVAAALLARLGPMDAMKLQKLLYYSQAWSLAITDREIFDDAIEGWWDGPVVRSVFNAHKGRRRLSSWPPGDPARLSSEARLLIDLVCISYGHLSGDELSTLTHSEAPWLDARDGLAPSDHGDRLISVEAMKRYFHGRELAGRTSADLAAGGLALTSAEPDATGYLAEVLADLRQQFTGEPDEHPSEPAEISGRSGSGIDPVIAARLAARRAQRMAS